LFIISGPYGFGWGAVNAPDLVSNYPPVQFFYISTLSIL